MFLFDKVFLGDRRNAKNLKFIQENKITRIINCTPDLKCHFENEETKILNDENVIKKTEDFDEMKPSSVKPLSVEDMDNYGFHFQSSVLPFYDSTDSIFHYEPNMDSKSNDDFLIGSKISSNEPIRYFRIPVQDSGEENIKKYFGKVVQFIKSAPEKVLIHCREAKSRSVAVAIAYLMKGCHLSLHDAYQTICSKTKDRINDGFKRQLMEYEREVFGVHVNSHDFFSTRREMKKSYNFYESPVSDQDDSPKKKQPQKRKHSTSPGYIQKTIPEMLTEKYHPPPTKSTPKKLVIPEFIEEIKLEDNTPKKSRLDEVVGKEITNTKSPGQSYFDDPKLWSEAKKKAFSQKDVNDNAYYYRFTEGGPEKKGTWSRDEKTLFMKLLAKFDRDTPSWGIFSKDIPGRCGYQCANFYRTLVAKGEVQDPNYQMDKNGKLIHSKK